MSQETKRQNNFTALKYAKRLQNLSLPEKKAIVAIADACGTFGGVCTKSIATLASEYGTGERSFQYGIHGRHEGKSPIAGLVSRGLIYPDGNLNGGGFYWDEKNNRRTGLTVRWRLNARAWMSYLTDEDAAEIVKYLPSQSDREGEHEGAHSERVRVNIPDRQGAHFQSQGAHFGVSGCTNADKFPKAFPPNTSPTPSPFHQDQKRGAGGETATQSKTPQRYSFTTGDLHEIKDCIETDAIEGCGSGGYEGVALDLSNEHLTKIKTVLEKRKVSMSERLLEVIGNAVQETLERDELDKDGNPKGWSGLDKPEAFFVPKFLRVLHRVIKQKQQEKLKQIKAQRESAKPPVPPAGQVQMTAGGILCEESVHKIEQTPPVSPQRPDTPPSVQMPEWAVKDYDVWRCKDCRVKVQRGGLCEHQEDCSHFVASETEDDHELEVAVAAGGVG